MSRRGDRGSVTAEFAVALPAVMLVLVLGVSALSAAGRQVRLQDAAADAARLVGRGEDPARAGSSVAAAVTGAAADIEFRGELVCVHASAPAATVSWFPPVTASSCALAGGR